ncbi:hypothetical protein GCM10027059_22130 [Myceligenerans halotolerans]
MTTRLELGSPDLPGTLQRTAFHVVQEGLTNARKHAPQAHAHVEVVADDGGARLTITNPLPVGVGAGEIPGAGAGMTGLDERVRLDGGTIDHPPRGGLDLNLLTDRERDAALAVAEGLGNTEIARELYLSPSTVKSHLSSALTKFGLANRTQPAIAVYEARRRN